MTTRETTVKLTVQDNFSAQLRAFATALDQSDKATQKTKKNFNIFNDANEQLASGIKSGLTMAVAAVPVVMLAAGAAAVKLGMDMEQTRTAFTRLTGSTEAANQHLQDLRDFAKTTPFQFTELTQASKRMMAFGFATKDVIPMMTDIGDAVSALGAGQEGINSVTRALGQMQAKGKVSAEEMNQLTEVGINGFKYVAQGMGKTTAEVMKLSERGLIPAGDAIQYILKGMRQDFGGGMAAQSKTAAGQVSNLVDSLEEMGTTIGEIMLPAVKSAIKGLTEFFDVMKLGIKTADTLVNWQAKLTEAFVGTERKIRDSADSYDEYTSATEATARAAGLIYDAFVVGEGVVTKYRDGFVMLTEAQFNASRGAYGLNGALDESNRAFNRATEAAQADTTAKGENSAATDMLSIGMKTLTTELIYNQAAQGLDSESALQLGLAMGVVNENTVYLTERLTALREKYDANKDGAIDAAEATRGYVREVAALRGVIDALKDKTVTVTYVENSRRVGGPSEDMPGMAIGGYTMGGNSILVGERGPETFQPMGPGKIVNNYNSFSMHIADGNGRRAANDFRMMQAWAGAST